MLSNALHSFPFQRLFSNSLVRHCQAGSFVYCSSFDRALCSSKKRFTVPICFSTVSRVFMCARNAAEPASPLVYQEMCLRAMRTPVSVAVERVQILDMAQQHAVDFIDLGRRQLRAGVQIVLDLAENPRPALRRAADHDGIGAGVFEHVSGFFRRGDVAVGDHRDRNRLLHRRDGVVFGIAGVDAGARAAMHGERLDAGSARRSARCAAHCGCPCPSRCGFSASPARSPP